MSFRPKWLPRSRQWEGGEITPREPCRVPDTSARLVVPVPKECVIQHRGYMDIVRGMHCAHCGRQPRSEFCHADQGKGIGIKTDCRLGWPGCSDDLMTHREGCHKFIGSRGTFTQAQRRALETRYGEQTRAKVLAAGLWPKDLPLWTEQ